MTTFNIEKGGLVDNRLVVEFALNGRQCFGLALLALDTNEPAGNSKVAEFLMAQISRGTPYPPSRSYRGGNGRVI